jgi:hypothetical protein
MAYLKPVRLVCDVDRCQKAATVELIGEGSVRFGQFCYGHGKTRLVELEADEHRKYQEGLQNAKGYGRWT